MKNISVALALVLGFSGAAVYAQETTTEGQSKMTVEEAKESKNKVAGDIDTELTNARIRAESGSKSKWSLSADLGYSGGTLSNAFGKERPNLSGEPGVPTQSSLALSPSLRYRWTKNDSVTLGTSLGVMTPLQGSVTFDDGKRVEQINFFDPSLSYNRAGKIGSLQTNGSVYLSVGTSTESRGIDNNMSYGVSYTLLHGFQNGVTIGSSVGLGYNFYTSAPGGNADTMRKPGSSYGSDKRTDWSLGLYPFVEYSFNDTYSFRTLFGYFNWRHNYGDSNQFRLLQTYVYQSVGVGISITRDIYLYPNIQFVPDNIRSDFSNLAMSASLNIF